MDYARTHSETVDRDRRQLLSAAARRLAAAGAASLLPTHPSVAATTDAIRPFHINIPEDDLVDLRRRVLTTRWPDRETVRDQSQGVQLAKLQELGALLGRGLRLAEDRGEA